MDDVKHPAVKRIKLLIAIVDRGKGIRLWRIEGNGVTYNLVSPATARPARISWTILGLSNPERIW
jgi:hypothetical protein